MADAKMQKLQKKCQRLKARVLEFGTYVSNKKTELINSTERVKRCEYLQFNERLETILPLHKEYQTFLEQLLELGSEETDDGFENSYFTVIGDAKEVLEIMSCVPSLDQVAHSSSDYTVGRVHDMQLPVIPLPKFNGQITRWLEFRDSFESMVHKSTKLSNVQKLYYLRSSLTDDAAQIISALDSSSESYQTAWELVCKRFENKRLLIQSHIRALLNCKQIKRESFQLLREMLDTISIHLRALQALGEKVEYWDSILIVIFASKFDDLTAREWEAHTKSKESFPKLDDIKTFLHEKAVMLENIKFNKSDFDIHNNNYNKPVSHKLKSLAFHASGVICNFCKESHTIYVCDKFKALSVPDRITQAKSLALCLVCLRIGHKTLDCRSTGCRKCNHKHNSLLHLERNEIATKSNASLGNKMSNFVSCLLPTAKVLMINIKNNIGQSMRALLDTGSQSNFVSERAVNMLGLDVEKINLRVEGINGSFSDIKGRCSFLIKSNCSNFETKLLALVVPEITSEYPQYQLDIGGFEIPNHIRLADPDFYVCGKIDVLLNVSIFLDILLAGKIKCENLTPTLLETKLGWIIAGNLTNVMSCFAQVKCCLSANKEIEDQLQKFWQIEECQLKSDIYCDDFAEIHFKDNYKRQSDGRFVVSIPFNKSLDLLGDSRNSAKQRFFNLEKRLQNNNKLAILYKDFMREYISLGHMRLVKNCDDAKYEFFLPHHGVLKESSLTTKLRVVFNGSHPTTSGYSLNSVQAIGPVIQRDLYANLIRFRRHLLALAADIAKMFRQVNIAENDVSMHRIFWRENPSDPLEIYELLTVTYGTRSASFLAIRPVKQCALDFLDIFPQSAQIIIDDFYVDDFLSGADSEEDAIKIISEVTQILNSGCFPLRKWSSNNSNILQNLKRDDDQLHILELGEDESTKTLGMFWEPQSDSFIFKISDNPDNDIVTKRVILSMTGQIFDPLGLVGASTVIAKVFLQSLWQEKLGWDEPVSESLRDSWLKYRQELKFLENIKIPRCVKISAENVSVQLHGFSDASEKSYGACVFLRFESAEGITVRLLSSKSKVAPLKTQTIPRLELCGAYLLTLLVTNIKNCDIKFDQMFLWTDSMDVLHWLQISPHLLKIFVGNRVARIQEMSNISDWRYVPSAQNPADLISRGVPPRLLKDCELWWQGPEFLMYNQETWPEVPDLKVNENVISAEFRPISKVFAATVNESENLINRFSSLIKAKRVIAYCMRFYQNCKISKDKRKFDSLTVQELNAAFFRLIRIDQACKYAEEIKRLKTNKNLNSNSNLIALNPFIDEDMLLRVGGRLKFASLCLDKKYPIILPPKTHLSFLIMKHEHVRLGHAGPQQVLASIREKFWPIRGLSYIKKLIRNCIVCFRVQPVNYVPIMGNLPRDRVTPSRPFYVSGVDFCGPFSIKRHGGRGSKLVKAYLSVFVCFSTKAVHIEVVSDLSTSAFLAALRRFVSRRGKPLKIWSDNATNFGGTYRELKDIVRDLENNSSVIENYLSQESIQWSFIPPSAPHFGGIWEASVKRVKFHLKRIIGQNLLTYEELHTLTCQIEAILNSRPLIPLTNNPDDLEALTPSHFLIGQTLTSLPDRDLNDTPDNRLSNFELIQKLLQQFWTRWRREYLPELQRRSKWRTNDDEKELKSGDLVLIEDRNQPPLCWSMGRVLEIHPGSDGVIRVATLKTRTSTLTRPVAKLYRLPLDFDAPLEGVAIHTDDDLHHDIDQHDTTSPASHAIVHDDSS